VAGRDRGYLEAHKQPGRTRERTHYTLTDRGREALAAWVRTPATLPREWLEEAERVLSGARSRSSRPAS
jgi:DNA-binding PadR family transcriptional regulator